MDTILTIGEIINKTKQYFAKHEVASPRLDAEILLCHVLGKDRVYLYVHFDQPLQKQEVDNYRELVVRRTKGEPVAYLTGTKYFLDMQFIVDRNVLIPRPETELLVERAIKLAQEKSCQLLDLGTGSGAIALSVLHNVQASKAVAVDVSHAALAVAKRNAEKYGLLDRVDFICNDMSLYLDACEERFSLLMSNPPYITKQEMQQLSSEVKMEPALALDGGEDGLDFYRMILSKAKKIITADGVILLEIGYAQAQAVQQIGQRAGFGKYGVIKDYAGLDRIVWLAGDEFIDANKVLAS